MLFRSATRPRPPGGIDQRILASDQRIMRTTSAFAARFRFVVWTLSCLSAFPSSLYTFSIRSFARRWHGGSRSAVAFTEFEKFYAKAE